MGHHAHNPYGADERAGRAIDRKREQERRHMLQEAYKNADTLGIKLVQRLLDKKIIETTSNTALSELFADLLMKLADLEEFEVQFKISPIRHLADNPNFISLYLTQYIIEDLIDHPKIQDIFGDDEDIYKAVDSIISVVRPR